MAASFRSSNTVGREGRPRAFSSVSAVSSVSFADEHGHPLSQSYSNACSRPQSRRGSVLTRLRSSTILQEDPGRRRARDVDETLRNRRTFDIDKPIETAANNLKNSNQDGVPAANVQVASHRATKSAASAHDANLVHTLRKFFFPKRGSVSNAIWYQTMGDDAGSDDSAIWKRGASLDAEGRSKAFFMIHPDSPLRINWDIFMLILLIINMIVIPLDVAFFASKRDTFWLVFNVFTDFAFVLDIALNFRTGFFCGTDARILNLNPKAVAKRYLKTWFIFDLTSAIPFDLIAGALLDEQGQSFRPTLRLVHMLKLINLVKLLRFSRLIGHWHGLQENYFLHSSGVYVRIFNLGMLMLCVVHWNACLQFFVCFALGFPDKSWVVKHHLEDASWFDQYIWAMFNAFSQMLCIGYGQFNPEIASDMFLTMLGMIVGATCYALLLGNVASLIQNLDFSTRLRMEQMREVEDYMSYREVPEVLKQKIRDYFERRFRGKVFNEDHILNSLSEPLRELVTRHNCQTALRSVPLFSSVLDDLFLSDLVRVLKYEFFQPSDLIIKRGTVGTKMYFLQSGRVHILSEGGPLWLREGSYFGEMCLLTQCERKASVKAETYCSAFSLSTENFNEVLDRHPSIKAAIQRILEDSSNITIN